MTAIDYVVRTKTGAAQRDTVASDNDVTVIPAGNGEEISLNLRQGDITNYTRQGGDLEIALADGRVVVLQNYFGADGAADSRLFISADGYLNEVTLVQSSDGSLYGQYGPVAQWGKWSPSDDLIFLDGTEIAAIDAGDEEVSMLGAGLLGGSGLLGWLGLGGAGVAGAAALSGGGSDGAAAAEPTPEPTPEPEAVPIVPTLDNDGPLTIGGDTAGPTNSPITVTGTAQPGSTVDVTIGSETVQTTADQNGNYSATFQGGTFPSDGTHTVSAVVTDLSGTQTTLSGATVTIDTTPPDANVTAGTVSVGEIINAVEHQSGVQISGAAEPGASISVTIEGVTHQATADGNGAWSVNFASGEIRTGEYTTPVQIVASDALGNTTSFSETLRVDTVPNALGINTATVETDGVVNAQELADGVLITGTSTPGATVTVEVQGQSQVVQADGNGNWSATYSSGLFPTGETSVGVTATSVDVAGNSSSTSGTIQIDTLVNQLNFSSVAVEGDNVVNISEASDGINLSGSVEPGSTATVSAFGRTYQAVVDASGNWTVAIPASDVPATEGNVNFIVNATDAAGNTASATHTVVVDTIAPDTPEIIGYFRQGSGYRSASIRTSQDDITIHQVDAGGAVSELNLHAIADPFLNETAYNFVDGAGQLSPISDGSELIVTGEDDAGNTSSTFVVLDETNSNRVDVTNPNFSGFDIETIDLRFGDQSQLTLSEADILALSGNSDQVVIQGDTDDTVTISGATAAGSTQVNGETHDVYTLGSATVVVDDDINIIT